MTRSQLLCSRNPAWRSMNINIRIHIHTMSFGHIIWTSKMWNAARIAAFSDPLYRHAFMASRNTWQPGALLVVQTQYLGWRRVALSRAAVWVDIVLMCGVRACCTACWCTAGCRHVLIMTLFAAGGPTAMVAIHMVSRTRDVLITPRSHDRCHTLWDSAEESTTVSLRPIEVTQGARDMAQVWKHGNANMRDAAWLLITTLRVWYGTFDCAALTSLTHTFSPRSSVIFRF